MSNYTVESVPCRRLSFFKLVESLISDEGQRRPLQHICSLMRKSGATWLCIEKNVNAPERTNFSSSYKAVAAELKDLRSYFQACTLSVTQLSFFNGSQPPPRKLEVPKLQSLIRKSDLMATCVVIHVRGTPKTPADGAPEEVFSDYVFEAVITSPASDRAKASDAGVFAHLTHHLHVYDEANVVVCDCPIELAATYFCQQNQITSSCSHAALKVAHWHTQNKGYQLATKAINDIVAQRIKRDFTPGDGLSWEDIELIADRFDMQLLDTDFEFNKHSDISPYELAYLFVESQFPTLIFFRTEDSNARSEYHVVPVIGHTMNTDEWLPTALRTYRKVPVNGLIAPKSTFLSSVEWVPHLIIHDDLLGPYMKIGPNSLTRAAMPYDPYHGRACRVTAVVPKRFGAGWSPLIAQQFGARIFWNYYRELQRDPGRSAWLARLRDRWSSPAVAARDMVVRTQLLRDGDSYSAHLARGRDFFGNRCTLTQSLRRKLDGNGLAWLIEVSIPELFCTNRAKLGDVLLPFSAATEQALKECQPNMAPTPIAVRMLGNLRVYGEDSRHKDFTFPLKSHTRLFSKHLHKEIH